MISANVFSEAAQLNQSPTIFAGYHDIPIRFPLKLDSEDIILEVLKRAEKEDALIARLYEPYGKSTIVQLDIPISVTEIHETDLMENSVEKLELSDNKLELQFDAFEIKTLKIVTG